MKIPCIQFINDVMNMHREQVEVACKGLNPVDLKAGTKIIPPPNPNPLKIPAPMLLSTIDPILDYTEF